MAMKTEPDARQDAQEEHDDGYVAFPGGIPKRWFNPAATIFIIVSPFYSAWVVIVTVWRGVKGGVPAVEIAGGIWTHLSAFLFGFSVSIIIACKILERIMYYLNVKKLIADSQKRAEEEERRAKEAVQRAEEAVQRAEEAAQQTDAVVRRAEEAAQNAEEAVQRAEAAEQRAETYQQSAEAYRQSAEEYRQIAEQYRQRAEKAEAERDA